MNKVIEVKRLSKSFGKVNAVNEISFYVEEGTLFSFLGTNGAGKSTTISILLTLLQQDAGGVKVKGFMVGKQDDQIRREIGVVFQESLLDDLLTVEENLKIRASFYGYSKIERDQAIERVATITDVTSFLKRPYGKLSGGEKRRADIARALVHEPSILILDEPTTGLDAQSRKNIWRMILHLQKETKMTVFLTTHYIEETVGSDYVVVMKEGTIVAKGTPDELKSRYASDRLLITTSNVKKLRNKLADETYKFYENKSTFYFPLKHTKDAIPIINKFEKLVTSFEVRKSSLEDVFIEVNKERGDNNADFHEA